MNLLTSNPLISRKGGFYGKHSKESKEKMRRAHVGKTLTSEHKEKISLAHKLSGLRPPSPKGKKWSLERKKRASEYWKAHPQVGMRGKHHSLESRIKISNAQKGEKSFQWKGGLTDKNKIIRMSLKYRLWREAVFKRDNWTCQLCKNRGGVELHPDHIKPFSLYPELRFELSNGRTLCVDCHKATDTYGAKLQVYMRKNASVRNFPSTI